MTGEPRRPPIEETIITAPSLRARISGTTIEISQLLAMMLFSRILRKASSEICASGP